MDPSNMSVEEMAELQKKNCIFCKIINKEIPSHEIFSDDKVFVILDINPANEGHCLVLPKQHYQILPQMPDDLIGYVFKIAKRTSRALLKSLSAKGTTIFAANGAIAGQKAPHFMVHVIPRKRGDMLFQVAKNPADEKQLLEIKSRLASRMATLTGRRAIEHKPETKEQVQAEKAPAAKSDAVDIDKIAEMFK